VDKLTISTLVQKLTASVLSNLNFSVMILQIRSQVNCKKYVVLGSVREYVFYVFFRFQKNMTFCVFFLNDVSKSRKKSLAKV